MTMKIVQPIPGQEREFPVGTRVVVVPARFVNKCFNISKPGFPLQILTTVPAEHLAETES